MKNYFGLLVLFTGFLAFLSGCATWEASEGDGGLLLAAGGAMMMWLGWCWSGMGSEDGPEEEEADEHAA